MSHLQNLEVGCCGLLIRKDEVVVLFHSSVRLNKKILAIDLTYYSLYDTFTLTPSLPHSLTPSLPHSLTPSLPHSLTPSLPHSLTPSLPHSLTLRHTPSGAFMGRRRMIRLGIFWRTLAMVSWSPFSTSKSLQPSIIITLSCLFSVFLSACEKY